MYKVRAWAHNTAQEHNFNPWASVSEKTRPSTEEGVPGDEQQLENGQVTSEKPKKPLVRRIFEPFKVVLLHSWINVLLVFVPAGIAVNFAGVDLNVVFALNAIAIIPLAGLLTFATECVAHRLGPTLGALMNVSFGNAVELIIFIIALVKNEIRVVQASLIGSILANLLLILGMALFIGGLEFQEQVYDSMVTQMSACLLAVASLSLLIPTAFHASFSDTAQADAAVLPISRGSSVILLLVYILYLLFQLKSHSYLYQGTPQHVIDEATQPGILQRFDSSSSDGSSTTSGASVMTGSTAETGGARRRVRKKLRVKLGRKRRTQTEEQIINEEEGEGTAAQAGSSSRNDSSSVPTPLLKEAEELGGPRSETAATVAVNVATARPPLATSRRPHLGGRVPTLRAPPVFRAQTNLEGMGLAQQHQFQYPVNQLRRLNSTPNMVRRPTGNNRIDGNPVGQGVSTPTRSNTGRTQASSKQEADDPPLSQTAAIITLLISTGLVAFCAELLVGSIQHLVDNSPLSEAFVGLIILPIVGNAAEHVTAVTVAAKNKLDLSMGVSLGSSIQIALFVTPLIVIIGWILDKAMSLYFTLFETAALFVSVFIVNFLVLDGRSNFLEGALLCASYVIIALGTYYYPDNDNSALS